MADLKARLIAELRKIEGMEDRPSAVAGGTALFYRGKELAHFHNGNELDLRLTRKVISALGLEHPRDSVHHPNRSRNSPWIEIRFNDARETTMLVSLVRRAAAEL